MTDSYPDPLRSFVEHIAANGMPCETNPSLGGRLGDGTEPRLWIQYLKDLDTLLKAQAKRILEEADNASRSRNIPDPLPIPPDVKKTLREALSSTSTTDTKITPVGADTNVPAFPLNPKGAGTVTVSTGMGRAIAEAEDRRVERDRRIANCDHSLNSSGWCRKNCGFGP